MTRGPGIDLLSWQRSPIDHPVSHRTIGRGGHPAEPLASTTTIDPRTFLEHTMYDMYPEWGPSRHYGDTTSDSSGAVQAGLDLRDNGGQRPEDN